jgi:hypothetical protein
MPWSARRIAGPIVVLSTAALLTVAVAGVQVTRNRNPVDQDLLAARAAADRVAQALGTGDVDTLGPDLELLASAGSKARTGSTGFTWAVADRADVGGVRALRRDAGRIATLAAAAPSLRVATTPLLMSDSAGLYDLDDLARALNRYATAAERAGDPSEAVLARAALAAGMLPALAGGDGARTWTVCREAAGPCSRIRVMAPGTASPPGRRWATGTDVLVVGIDPKALFEPARTFDPAAVFDLLLRLGRNTGVTVQSAVGTEQQAIDRLTAS